MIATRNDNEERMAGGGLICGWAMENGQRAKRETIETLSGLVGECEPGTAKKRTNFRNSPSVLPKFVRQTSLLFQIGPPSTKRSVNATMMKGVADFE